MNHSKYMQMAIEKAKEGITNGGGPFGATIVKDGVVIACENNNVTNNNDPTAHAEVQAIRAACQKLNTFDLSGCEIFASSEPCPMCLSAIYWARIDKVYYANPKDVAAKVGFIDDFIYEEFNKKPEDRNLKCIHLKEMNADEIFRLWDQHDEKIEY